jgi:hypothetical protein
LPIGVATTYKVPRSTGLSIDTAMGAPDTLVFCA